MSPWLLPTPASRGRSRQRMVHYAIVLALGLTASVALAQDATGDAGGVLGSSIGDTLQRGGTVMYLILALSIVGFGFILEAAWRSRNGAILPRSLEKELDDGADEAVIAQLAKAEAGTVIQGILAAGYLWRHGSGEEIAAAIEEKTDERLWQLKRTVRPLGIIANTAPLLGLLGTVIGIIQAFDVVARQGALGDPGALAGGISKALLTTCFGLIVAIPLLLAYHFFIGRIEAQTRKCEILAKAHLILPPAPEEERQTGKPEG